MIELKKYILLISNRVISVNKKILDICFMSKYSIKKYQKCIIAMLMVILLYGFLGFLPTWLEIMTFGHSSNAEEHIFLVYFLLSGSLILIFFIIAIIQDNLFRRSLRKILLLLFVLSTSSIILIDIISRIIIKYFTDNPLVFLLILAVPALPVILYKISQKFEKRYRLLNLGDYLFALLILNIISWFFIGRPSSLFLAKYDYSLFYMRACDSTYTHSFYDSIYVDISDHDLPFYKTDICDFSSRRVKKFIYDLKRDYNTKNVYVFNNYITLHEAPVYGAEFILSIPLCCYVEKSYGVALAAQGYHSFYIWFFRWIKIKEELDWLS